jgi:hypothetical protein
VILHLDQIVDLIDGAFGDEMPFSEQPLAAEDRDVLGRIFGERGYQRYLQDQVNRQIIRDYLMNAVLLGHLSEPALEQVIRRVGTTHGRAAMSLHMLMSSVEQAADLTDVSPEEALKALEPESGSPPHIRLVQS